jgi:hypothetical protein
VNLLRDLLTDWPAVSGMWVALGLAWLGLTIFAAQRLWRQCHRWVSRFRHRNLAAALQNESGASYSISILLLLPLYLVICLCFAETTLMLSTKLGTMYAAHAGARSLAVWDWVNPAVRENRLQQSVLTGLGTFVASGHELFSSAGTANWDPSQHIDDYHAALESLAQRSVDSERMQTHLERVAARTTIDWSVPDRQPFADVTVQVTYRAPFLFYAVGRLFDPDGRPPFELPVPSIVTLTLERPVSDDGTLGIDYVAE